jgi:pimeloyl-[acyl-carrier protein] methyl ester esterase
VKLHVDHVGSGPDLVLLHGWGLHSGAWTDVMPRLAASFRVHAVDLPGHGFSAQVCCETFEQAVDAVADAMPPGAILCGWSLGGLMAQRLAQRDPGCVRALALVGATPCFVEREDWPAAMSTAAFVQFESGLLDDCDGTLARFVRIAALNGSGAREAIRELTARLGERGTPSGEGLATALDWLRETDLRPVVREMALPAVVIHGRNDALTPIAAGRWLAATLPRARLIELEDCAHLPFITHRGAFVHGLESLVG